MTKNQEGFMNENWDAKRALMVSIQVALIYACFSLIWIWIFGAKSEIVWNLKFTEEITKTIILPWNSYINISPNFIGIVLSGICFFSTLKFLNNQVEKGNVCKSDLGLALGIALFVAFCVGFFVGINFGLGNALGIALFFALGFGLGIALVVGLVVGLGIALVVGLFFTLGIALGVPFVDGLGVSLGVSLGIAFGIALVVGFRAGFFLD